MPFVFEIRQLPPGADLGQTLVIDLDTHRPNDSSVYANLVVPSGSVRYFSRRALIRSVDESRPRWERYDRTRWWLGVSGATAFIPGTANVFRIISNRSTSAPAAAAANLGRCQPGLRAS